MGRVTDDGKRASSAIEVADQGASPLEGGLGETSAGSLGRVTDLLVRADLYPCFSKGALICTPFLRVQIRKMEENRGRDQPVTASMICT